MEKILFLYFSFFIYSLAEDHCNRLSSAPRHKTLSLGVLLPDTYRRQIEPSVKLALRHVHSNPNLLPDYCIKLVFKNTEVGYIFLDKNGPIRTGAVRQFLLNFSIL